MRRSFFFCCCLMFHVVVSYAQTELSGKVVTREDRQGLEWASVVAENNQHKPVAFTKTGKGGLFVINIPSGKSVSFLSVSMLGYEKITVSTDSFQNGSVITIGEQPFELKEVKAVSKRIKQQSDTLIYSVAGFRQKQDRSIADVISKMPGLEVADNGTIKYLGRPIENLYIEGMDLMGGNYTMASENLNAAKVKEVQVLTHHQQVQALRNVQFSDQTSLNLVLEEDARNTWIGLLEIGGGTALQESNSDKLLRDGRLMAMMFNGKQQSLSVYKWNNTGQDIKKELLGQNDFLYAMDASMNMTSEIAIGAPNLKRERYLMNDSRLLATNWLNKAGEDATVRLQFSGYLDKTEGYRATETAYSNALGGIVIQETAQGEKNSSEWKGELKYEKNGKNIFVKNTLGGYIDFNKEWAQTMMNGDAISQNLVPRQRWIGDELEIVKSMGEDQILQFNASAITNYQPGTLMLIDSTSQHIDQHTTKVNAYATFRHKLFRRFYVSYQAGASYKDQRFCIYRDDNIRRNDKYQQADLFFRPSVQVKQNGWIWSLSLPIKLAYQYYRQDHGALFVFEPKCSFEYQLSSEFTVRASYQYRWAPATLASMTDIPVYQNYREVMIGVGERYATKSHNCIAGIDYTNLPAGLFINVNTAWLSNNHMPLYDTKVDSTTYISFFNGRFENNHDWMLGGRISKSLGTMKFVASLHGQLRFTYYTSMMGGQKYPFRFDNHQVGLTLSLRPCKVLSLEEESRYRYSKQNAKENHELDSRALQYFSHELKLFLFLGKWQAEWDNEAYHCNDHSVSFNYFTDIQVSYLAKKYEIGIRLNNLFGTHTYERHHISSYATTYTVNHLRPREVVLKASLDL